MKTRFSLLLASLGCLASVVQLTAQGLAFTYQGQLSVGSAPANGPHDFQFTLFGGPNGGDPVAEPLTNSAVTVSNGLFTVLLAFGSGGFTGADRWLDIAVRPAGNGAFTALNPRQPITPTPYALTALNALSMPGVNGHSLSAADGSPTNAVFVNNAGNVGIGTTSPATRLHVASGAEDSSPPRLETRGLSGFAAGWDFYYENVGKGYVGVPDPAAPLAPGEMVLFGGPGTKVSLWSGGVRSLTADTAGNVEVRGDIRLGPSGQLRATSGEENLRIIRGVVNTAGEIIAGSGFTVSFVEFGVFDITFNTPFAGPPAVTVTAHQAHSNVFYVTTTEGVTRAIARIAVRGGETPLHFTAIGPR